MLWVCGCACCSAEPIGMSCAAGAMVVRQRRIQERQKGVLACCAEGAGKPAQPQGEREQQDKTETQESPFKKRSCPVSPSKGKCASLVGAV